MRTYAVLTPIRGLPRAEPWCAHEPIPAGSVILLPRDVAIGLEQIGAIEASDAAETVLLDFSEPEPPALIASDDVDGLIAAVRNVGGVAKIIAAADVDELRAALDALPGSVAPIMPAEATPVEALGRATNLALVLELRVRIDGGQFDPATLAGLIPENLLTPRGFDNGQLTNEIAQRAQDGRLSQPEVDGLIAWLQAEPASDTPASDTPASDTPASDAGSVRLDGEVVGTLVGVYSHSASDYSAAEAQLVVPAEAPASEPPAAPAAKKSRAKKAD